MPSARRRRAGRRAHPNVREPPEPHVRLIVSGLDRLFVTIGPAYDALTRPPPRGDPSGCPQRRPRRDARRAPRDRPARGRRRPRRGVPLGFRAPAGWPSRALAGYPPDDLPALESAPCGAADHPVKLAAEERIQTVGRPERRRPDRRRLADRGRSRRDRGADRRAGARGRERRPTRTSASASPHSSDLVAVVVDRARLATNAAERIDWAERVANSDALTGLANGRTLSAGPGARARPRGAPGLEISVALFDVDDLTGLNDTEGKAAGDDALREVAAVIGESVRYVDTVARWGGDEFLLVAPGAKGTTVVAAHRRRRRRASRWRANAGARSLSASRGSRWMARRATSSSRRAQRPRSGPPRPWARHAGRGRARGGTGRGPAITSGAAGA